MKSKSICFAYAFLLFALTGNAPAIALTFDLVGTPYDTNTDPGLFGSHMTGSVTLNCNPCADGTYNFDNPIVTGYQLTSGTVTSSPSWFTGTLSIDYITISDDAVVSPWFISITDPSLA